MRSKEKKQGFAISTSLPAMEGAGYACWSQAAWNRSWLLVQGDTHYNWTNCEAGHWSKVPVTLPICLCGLLGNGAVLWFFTSHVRRSPITIYVLNLAVADFTFLLSITIALVILYAPETLCHRLGSRDVTAALNITILFSFTASVYLLTAFSAMAALSVLPMPPCHSSQCLPVLVCALFWALSFLLTVTLIFCPAALIAFVLSYLLSLLTLVLCGLTLLARVLCCSWQHPPWQLCAVVLLAVVFFPFFTAGFGYWLLIRLFDFSVFVFDDSLPLACVNSSINPGVYFLAGSCTKKFVLSVRAAFKRAFGDVTEPQNRGETRRASTVEPAV